MSANTSTMESSKDKIMSETTVQTVPQNLTTIQSIQTVQSMQSTHNAVTSSIQATQVSAQSLVGKSISLDLNSSKLLMKQSIPSNIVTSDSGKLTTSQFSPVTLGSTVRIISPNMLSTLERQSQTQTQQSSQQGHQIVTTMPATYHVPRGPAAVASISTPRATVATPLVRAISTVQQMSITRPGITTTVSNSQWQPKVVYAQPQRHPIPVVTRPATVVTATPSRLITPVLQAQNSSITRLPTPTRPPTPQVVTSLPQVSQAGRSITQTIQPIQTSRPLTTTPINRVAVSAPVVGAPNRVATVTSVQTSVGRQLTVNTAAGASAVTASRIVIPQQAVIRLLVEPGYEESAAKPNASPRPSILRKREIDSSPAKGIAKNLAPVLASLPTSSSSSPPGSPKGDRDGGGNQSSGSTTVSATSSPGLDEEPEQSRITINPSVEMSPRKKPRKQQLTGVELTTSRCTDEEMQFITEERMKKEIKEDVKDKFIERKHNPNLQDMKPPQAAPIKSKPTPSLLGTSWKNRWGGRLHHYRRPSDVRPREERRPSVNEIAQQKHVLQKVNGWKVYHLTSQMEDLAELEKSVHEKLKATLTMLESQQSKGRQDDSLERANELIKGNMQRSSLISEGMNEARVQLTAIFQHKTYVADLLQRCSNKRVQKKRDK
ncbi:hypothetical protein QAD02_004637 [Eretmocerus hayati]|uniref:Uncharacterized protein n=1 Tax=Eretmocerus hayati TaxID=131215 RepID=A0ACC2NQ37_9HYME|nr:hypothetical protein QAD02_004637 [Eretmocerus hayati]